MKFLVGLMILVLAGCAGVSTPSDANGNLKNLVSWQSNTGSLLLTLNFAVDAPFYSLSNSVLMLNGVKLSQSFIELRKYGVFFVEPKPNDIQISGTGMDRTIIFSGGDGGATFSVAIYIENARIKKWVLSGSDIKGSPLVFHD